MDWTIPDALYDLDESALYRLLGDAWYAQFVLNLSDGHYFAASEAIGKREFDRLAPLLRADLRFPRRGDVVACVVVTIRKSGTWRMPAYVVAALVVKDQLSKLQRTAAAE